MEQWFQDAPVTDFGINMYSVLCCFMLRGGQPRNMDGECSGLLIDGEQGSK
jgi:hypothetical protein